MLTYEYECINCHIHFERRQRISDAPIRTCPECAGEVRRVFHPAVVIFKGSGFYATDNRRGSNGASRSGRKDSDSAPSNGKGETSEAPKAEVTKSEGEKPKP